jgi:GT2 family glycosyltransferase
VGFIDDDCVPGAGWVEAAAAAVARGEADVVEGRTECPGARDTPFEEHVENLSGGVLWSCNMVVRREVFERLGGFDEAFLEAAGEDMEFAWRLRASGARIVFEPALAVEHPPRRIGWRHLWRRLWRTRWGVLYHVKTTGRGGVLLGEPVDLLRCTAQLITRFDGARWRTRLFGIAWRWATFPLVYPYLIYWSWRYRRMGGRGDGG